MEFCFGYVCLKFQLVCFEFKDFFVRDSGSLYHIVCINFVVFIYAALKVSGCAMI